MKLLIEFIEYRRYTNSGRAQTITKIQKHFFLFRKMIVSNTNFSLSRNCS